MKKIISIVLALMMCAAVSACGQETSESKEESVKKLASKFLHSLLVSDYKAMLRQSIFVNDNLIKTAGEQDFEENHYDSMPTGKDEKVLGAEFFGAESSQVRDYIDFINEVLDSGKLEQGTKLTADVNRATDRAIVSCEYHEWDYGQQRERKYEMYLDYLYIEGEWKYVSNAQTRDGLKCMNE